MILVGLVAALALVLTTVDSADAWGCHGCRGGWGAYSVGYGGYSPYVAGYWGGGCCGTSYYAAPACSTCTTGCYGGGCYGGGCASGTCYSSSYWGYPTYYESYYPSYPVYSGCSTCLGSTTVTSATASTVASTQPATPTASGQVVFTVTVPGDAKVFVNDRPTTSTGTQRSYTAGGLVPGYRYGFTVRTERVVDGRLLSESQALQLTAGQTGQLVFNLTPSSTQVASQPSRPLVNLASKQ
jgi:uncharacterized protein (TIGR03000 family)